ncbi:hypothetical protein EDB85DRAFT_1918275 [Lactarius pseudohatsudake]|nr:hypothetical protein EDB85DRAFT_1918275 [Lactarius pseudohatsudake]
MPSLLLTSIWQTLGTEHLLWSQFPSAPQASGSVIESFTCVSFVVIRTATYFPRDATDAPQDACVSQCGGECAVILPATVCPHQSFTLEAPGIIFIYFWSTDGGRGDRILLPESCIFGSADPQLSVLYVPWMKW